MRAGDPVSAAALAEGGERLRTRAMQAALDLDPTFNDRYDDLVR